MFLLWGWCFLNFMGVIQLAIQYLTLMTVWCNVSRLLNSSCCNNCIGLYASLQLLVIIKCKYMQCSEFCNVSFVLILLQLSLPSIAVSALSLSVGQQKEHLACKETEWWGSGMVVCLDRGADDLPVVQLMPLSPPTSLFQRNLEWFTLRKAIKRVLLLLSPQTRVLFIFTSLWMVSSYSLLYHIHVAQCICIAVSLLTIPLSFTVTGCFLS